MANLKVYSSRLTAAQNTACQKAEAVSGLPPVGIEDLDAGHLTPKEFWRLNLMTAHDINVTIQNLSFPVDE
jgi:hypothetical protein